jgi:hypothetical protein
MSGGGSGSAIDSSTEALLRSEAQFGERELAVARAGGRVVRTPDTGITREMATIGVARFEVPFDYYVDRARRGDLYRTGATLLEVGRFSEEPSVADLRGLTLDADDLAPLKDTDPAAGRSEAAAKQFCVRLVRAYRATGLDSLEAVKQGSKRTALQGEVEALLKHATYLRRYGYPPEEAVRAQEYYGWAKVHIGLKRLLRLTKVTVWTVEEGNRREAVIVTEQIYASRYFQASLQVDHVIADEGDGRAPAIYLVTINRGRCEVLESWAVRLLRPLIMSRTRASTERALDTAKEKLESEFHGNGARPLANS